MPKQTNICKCGHSWSWHNEKATRTNDLKVCLSRPNCECHEFRLGGTKKQAKKQELIDILSSIARGNAKNGFKSILMPLFNDSRGKK